MRAVVLASNPNSRYADNCHHSMSIALCGDSYDFALYILSVSKLMVIYPYREEVVSYPTDFKNRLAAERSRYSEKDVGVAVAYFLRHNRAIAQRHEKEKLHILQEPVVRISRKKMNLCPNLSARTLTICWMDEWSGWFLGSI